MLTYGIFGPGRFRFSLRNDFMDPSYWTGLGRSADGPDFINDLIEILRFNKQRKLIRFMTDNVKSMYEKGILLTSYFILLSMSWNSTDNISPHTFIEEGDNKIICERMAQKK